MPLWNNDKNVMLVAGHRGARRIRPENTMTAFKYAIDAGVDMVETDIRQTKDNQLVLMHDARVDRTAHFDQAVGTRRLSVVDVGNNGEVANSALFCHSVSRSCSETCYYTPWSKPL